MALEGRARKTRSASLTPELIFGQDQNRQNTFDLKRKALHNDLLPILSSTVSCSSLDSARLMFWTNQPIDILSLTANKHQQEPFEAWNFFVHTQSKILLAQNFQSQKVNTDTFLCPHFPLFVPVCPIVGPGNLMGRDGWQITESSNGGPRPELNLIGAFNQITKCRRATQSRINCLAN